MPAKGRPKRVAATVTESVVIEPKKREKRERKIEKAEEKEEIVEKKPRKNTKKEVQNGTTQVLTEVPVEDSVITKTTGRKAKKKDPEPLQSVEESEVPEKAVKVVENNEKRSRKKMPVSPIKENNPTEEESKSEEMVEVAIKKSGKSKEVAATNKVQQNNRRRGRPQTAKSEEKEEIVQKENGEKENGINEQPPTKRGRPRKQIIEKAEKNGKENMSKTTAAASKKTVSNEKGRKRNALPSEGKKSEANKNDHFEDESEKENDDEESDTTEEVPKKKSRKVEKEKQGSTKTKVNATKTNYDKINFLLPKEYNLKISSWNVAGLRSWLQKGGHEFIKHEKPDIFCLQEIKCSNDQIPEEARFPGYHPYWLCKPGGYAGVALYSKIMPINVEYGIGDEEQDADGRILTAEYEKFYVVVVYVPNSGRGLVTLPKRLRWNKIFHEYLCKLNEKKSVIIAGDMNVSHKEIDLANPKTNKKSAGFTQEERDGMTELLSLGFIDTFRHFYPNLEKYYTYWTYMANARSRNVGWRLDYFIVSERLMKKCVDNVIRSEVVGSDHCPITLFLKI